MNSLELKKLLLCSSLLMGGMAFNSNSFAQTQQDDEAAQVVVPVADDNDEEDDKDNIIVTGSRIRKSTFSSIQPLQVLSTDDKIDVGLINPVDILQQTESAAGQQIDSTFQGFVLDNGPGSETLNLRGLGASRTLILINGRRYGPAGVEGAPSSPSINLIPGSLVEQFDLLLDGASSVYGSDAVAGVANAVLKRDFEGLELFASGNLTEQASNTDFVLSATWGKNWDRGFIGMGLEYDFQDEVKFGDRDFLRGCETNVEEDQQGNRYRRDRFDELRYAEWFGGFQAADGRGPRGECISSGIAGRIIERGGIGFGSIYRQPGTTTNIGIPGFVDQTYFGVPIDGDNDGVQDYGFQQFAINGNDLETSLFNQQKQISFMTYGEYTFEGEANITPFYEALYVNLDVTGDSGTPQLFPRVSANNPFNPCGVNGIDCAAGLGQVTFNPGFRTRWGQYYADVDPNRDGNTNDARVCAQFGIPAAACVPDIFGIGPYNAGPIVTQAVTAVDGDRDGTDVNLKQLRLVGGFKGDIPWMTLGSNWSFESTLSFQRSVGKSSRLGIRGDRLNFALGNDIDTGAPVGNTPCVASPGQNVRPDVLAGCVPVNIFADSLYPGTVVGDFATAAERNYLFDSRDFDTVYKQTVWNTFVSGNILELPAGSVGISLGGEYRIDDIKSIPDDVARDGLFFGFFSDSGAVGKKYTRELFGEISIPLVADKPFFRQLDIQGAGRLTDDEFYGTNYTYSGQVGWRPFDSLLLKATTGTSFRAPNLRENFLVGTTGFLNLNDPCVVPLSARGLDLNGNTVYDPSGDQRDQITIAACQREGVDPLSLGLNPLRNPVGSTEVSRGGSLALKPETSESYTLGASFEQPWFDSFDLSLNATYYNIDIKQGIVEGNAGFIINSCYIFNAQSRSEFCNFVGRDSDGFIDLVSAGFINRDTDKVEGLDLNVEFSKEFNAFNMPMEFGSRIRANHLIERSTVQIDANGNPIRDTFEGEFGFPDWTATGTFWLDIDQDWRVLWETRYIDAVAQDQAFVDPYSDVFDNLNTGTFSDTCGGAPVGGPICRDVGYADAYDVHTLAIRWNHDTWRFGAGVSNIFNKKPPEVDGSEVFSISNVPIGNGYNLAGREFFATIRKSF